MNDADNETISQQILPYLESFSSSVKLKRHLEVRLPTSMWYDELTIARKSLGLPVQPLPSPTNTSTTASQAYPHQPLSFHLVNQTSQVLHHHPSKPPELPALRHPAYRPELPHLTSSVRNSAPTAKSTSRTRIHRNGVGSRRSTLLLVLRHLILLSLAVVRPLPPIEVRALPLECLSDREVLRSKRPSRRRQRQGLRPDL